MRYFHGKHHVTSHFELASHKGFHGILPTLCNGNPVFTAGSKGGIRILNAARDKLAHTVDDLEGPHPGFVSCNIPLEGFGHACCCRRIKSASHCFEKFGNCHHCNL